MIHRIKSFFQNHVMVWMNKRVYGIESCYNPNIILSGLKHVDSVILNDGSIFKATKNFWVVLDEVRSEYDFSDMRSTDILLDIGAHIGSVTIPAAHRVKHVFAIEPLFTEELRENVRLNGLTNVTILPIALGDGGTIDLKFFESEKKNIQTHSFKEIIAMCGRNIDFLKCDCEGGEWYIDTKDLNGIRRLEMEIHPMMAPTEKTNPELIPYIQTNWCVTKTVLSSTYTIHAKNNEKNDLSCFETPE